ncbi:hypothetical protein ZOSMA_55G00110, partial [Zostera marina]
MEFSLAWKEAFFVEIKHSVVGNRGVEAQVSGLKFLVSMNFHSLPPLPWVCLENSTGNAKICLKWSI